MKIDKVVQALNDRARAAKNVTTQQGAREHLDGSFKTTEAKNIDGLLKNPQQHTAFTDAAEALSGQATNKDAFKEAIKNLRKAKNETEFATAYHEVAKQLGDTKHYSAGNLNETLAAGQKASGAPASGASGTVPPPKYDSAAQTITVKIDGNDKVVN